MIHSDTGPQKFDDPERTCRRYRRKGRQNYRARFAARARQGQSYRQRAVRQGGRRSLDPADDLHRADTRAAARQKRTRTPLPRSDIAARVRRLSAARLRSGDAQKSGAAERPDQRVLLRGGPVAELALCAAALYFSKLHPRAALRARPRRQCRRATCGASRRRGGAALQPELQSRSDPSNFSICGGKAVSISCLPAS